MQIPLPASDVTVGFLPFASVAVAMIAVTVFILAMLLPRDRTAIALTTMIIGLAVLAGGSLLLLSLLFVYLDPNGTTAWTWVLVCFNFMMMFPAGLWFVSLIAFEDRKVDWHSWVWPASIALALVGSEMLMGVLFAVGGGNAPTTWAGATSLGLNSVWFDWSMAAVMVALLVWLPVHGVVRGSLAALTAAAVLAPWVVATPLIGAAGMAALMAVVFVQLYRYFHRTPPVRSAEIRVVLGLAAAFGAMVLVQAAIVAAPASNSAAVAFGLTMALVMGAEVAFVVRESRDSYYTDIKRVQVASPTGAL